MKNTELQLKDNTVPGVIAYLTEELAKLKKITDVPPHTNGQIDLGNGSTINIQTENKIENLIKAYSSVKGRSEAYDAAMAELGVTEAPVFQAGGTKDQICADIKLRIAIIQQEDKKKELESLINEAKTYLSQEDQKALFLAKLSKVSTLKQLD